MHAERHADGGFKVALLNPGPISDAGWNASAYEGLLAIRDQLGAEISQVETKTPPEFEQAFRDYARRGFRLVIGHGFEFQDAAARVAPDFPDTVFITTSGNTVRPNVAPIVFRLEEATYLLGELAARMAPNGKACAVGGMEIPSVKSTFLAFEAGAAHVRTGLSGDDLVRRQLGRRRRRAHRDAGAHRARLPLRPPQRRRRRARASSRPRPSAASSPSERTAPRTTSRPTSSSRAP